MRFNTRRAIMSALFTTTALAAAPAFAQEAPADDTTVDPSEIVVTAQKRSENLQNVPISIQALGTQKLDQLNISDFKGYAAQLPSVSFQSSGAPGSSVIYMRGIASGSDGNHSGSLPSVGVYLDEQPVTTIGGNLDVHIYDIARIESLSGPQGTLYGASSEAGTIRIITNKPSTAGFEGRIDGEVNTIDHGGWGGKLEGMINAPLSSSAALRVVGFYQKDAGFIDNVPGSRSFLDGAVIDAAPLGKGNAAPALAAAAAAGGITVDNAAFVKNNYNYTDTWGGRAALKLDLDDNWTVTPTVLYQEQRAYGTFAFDPSVGDLKIQRFFPEGRRDRFIQAALTLEGKLGNWDVTYAGAYLDHTDRTESDYTDYAEYYDSYYASSGGIAGYQYFVDSLGNTIDPRQHILGTDHFKKMSHELRIASPSTDRFRLVAGMFLQHQSNDILQDYQVTNLAPAMSVNGSPGTLWLTKQHRNDRDYAMFGEASFDVTDTFTLTGGLRVFMYDNDLIGFFGFGANPANNYQASPTNAVDTRKYGVSQCFTTAGDRLYDRATDTFSSSSTLLPGVVAGTPCTNLGVATNGTVIPVKAVGSGVTYRFNATWKPVQGMMVYGTFSRGFRPGGQNRFGDFGAYQPDYLKNYEIGFKTSPARGVRLNGAVYRQDWDNFQFSYLGPNSFTVIINGPNARIWGAELDAGYNVENFALNVNASYTDAIMQKNLCRGFDPTFECTNDLPNGDPNSIKAPKGTRLPITPQFKIAGTMRYTVPMGDAKAYGQVNASYQTWARSALRDGDAALLGRLDPYGLVNLAVGADWDKFNLELFVSNVFDERGQVSKFVQCGSCSRIYTVPTVPRMFGLRVGAKY
ncbi:TonB-dependent receptor [Novosphingobium aquiterrae]|uniref:TonB-dependent receptor n=1 Tax=Novosphingobium aquiterrae TaxID=624388 RepID=A0ABV6PK81_9SPHN